MSRLSNNLVAYFPLDGNALDYNPTATKNNGTVTGALPTAAQSPAIPASLAYKFNGSSDKIEMSGSSSVKTAMFWAKPSSLNNNYLQLTASAFITDNGELYNSRFFNDPNLVSYYRLEDVNDSKGSYTLTNNNSVTFDAAKFNNGANCNGTKNLSISNALGLSGTSNFTYSFWAKMNADISSSLGFFFRHSIGNTASDNYYDLYYDYNGGTRRIIARRYGGSTTLTYNTTLGTTWHHIAFTYDGTNATLYLDGSIVAGPTSSSGTIAAGVTQQLYLGNNWNGDTSFPINAIIDDFAVFTRALSAAEISELYSTTRPYATGFTSPEIYVNGKKHNNLKLNNWNLIAVTSSSAVTASAIKLGIQNSSYFTGSMQEVALFDRQLSAREISDYYLWATGAKKTFSQNIQNYIALATTQIQTVTAKARIKITGIVKSITAKSRVKVTGIVKTIQAKSRVKKLDNIQSVTAKASIEQAGARTIRAKARVNQAGVIKTVTAKGRVKRIGLVDSVQAKARIKQAGLIKTVTAKSRLTKSGETKTIQAKARITGTAAVATIRAKGRINATIAKTLSAKSNIKKLGVARTIRAKAKIWAMPDGFVKLQSHDQEWPITFNEGRTL